VTFKWLHNLNDRFLGHASVFGTDEKRQAITRMA
jgi:hypothetical protein